MLLRDRNHPSIVIWGIGNEIPELEVDRGAALARQLVDHVHSLDNTRPLTLAFPGTTTNPTAEAVFSQLDITGYNYNILPTYKQDHEQLPSRIMLTTESWPSKAFPLWQISHDNSYVLGDLTWTAMDYLGESGIGAWQYGTPEQAKMAVGMESMMAGTAMVDQLFTGMANGRDVMGEMAKNNSDPNAKAMMELFFHPYPWHAAACGDLDLTGFRKPASFYRDIIWNGGDRVYATVRMPEPEGKKIIAIMWAKYPTLSSWSWPGEEGKELEVEVYSGAEKVRLYLNDKLIGEKPTGRGQEFKAVFPVPYAPGTLKAVGLRGDRVVAENLLTTVGPAVRLRLTADRTVLQADGEDLSFVTVEAVDAEGRPRSQGRPAGSVHPRWPRCDCGRWKWRRTGSGFLPGRSTQTLSGPRPHGNSHIEGDWPHYIDSEKHRSRRRFVDDRHQGRQAPGRITVTKPVESAHIGKRGRARADGMNAPDTAVPATDSPPGSGTAREISLDKRADGQKIAIGTILFGAAKRRPRRWLNPRVPKGRRSRKLFSSCLISNSQNPLC